MKRRLLIAVALCALGAQVFAQQITRVGVIDLQKVYMTYYKDSQAVRAFEDEKLRVQDEIKRLGEEIKELQRQRLTLAATADAQTLRTFDENLYRKAQYLSDFVKVRQADLDDKAQTLSKSDSFIQMLYRTVQAISEADGYSLVISSRNADNVGSSIIWFSPMIDITDKVIQTLLGS